MEEITGPIIAITLVLSAVFVPCAFITGITGRFFRQFAVTIAASTIISAINAITMTPSRALLIFKSQGKAPGHGHKREALPWWLFGIVGGLISVWLGPKFLNWADLELPVATVQSGIFNLHNTILFIPGLVLGLAVGWFLILPVNLVLGAFFRA